MSKRRITDQQTSRIQKKQARYHEQVGLPSHGDLVDGLVITRFGRHALIEDTQGQEIHCSIRPALSSLVAGDRVIWQPEGKTQGVVLSIYPRQSILNRPDARGVLKPIAANITQIMITLAPVPAISWILLDSYLVMAETLHIKACIVLNKIDLPCETIKEKLIQDYASLGYKVLFTSIQMRRDARDDLLQTLNHETSVFVGQSGVGKSSIISAILPHMDISTGAISDFSNLGRHTTSNSRLYRIAGDGHLIDSPGIRELGLWAISERTIAEGFCEFRPFLQQCQFRNCKHANTVGCAIIQATQSGKIKPSRYDNYLKLVEKFSRVDNKPTST